MLKKLCALSALLVLAACATSAPRTFTGQFEPPPAGSRVLVMTPDVRLSMLTAAGLQESRADWSQAGRENLTAALTSTLQSRTHSISHLDPATAMDGRVGQIIRLHEAVGSSIIAIDYMRLPIPTRRDRFDWTLGTGAQEIATAHNADYALFISASGSYASSGRVMVMIGMAALGAAVPLGGQQVFASLVDLRTGNVIWFNVATATPNQDMRTTEGAASLTASLLRDVPL